MNSSIQNIFAAAGKFAGTAAFCGILGASALVVATSANAQTTSIFPLPAPVVSTVPSNGDVNPYGVAFAPGNMRTDGTLQPGDILVSNFNNADNLQGTGTTIVRVTTRGAVSTFFQGQTGLGLTAALGVVRDGIVFAGNTPTADGTSNTLQNGSLLILDRNGKMLGSLTDPNLVAGPWGMAIRDLGAGAQVFFSNVLNGTITRLDVVFGGNGEAVSVRKAVTIANGYNHRPDPAALVLGPSGLFYDAGHDILYVASSADNAVYAVPQAAERTDANAGTGKVIYQDTQHLHGPIELAATATGHLIVANSDGSNVDANQPSELVEFTVDGTFVAQYSVDKNNGGAFGVATSLIGGAALKLAAVDDNANTLNIFIAPIQ